MINTQDFGASFSHDRTHRYSLWRIWDRSKPLVMFIGLNPSTANENENDPTIRSCGRIAKANGYGGFYMMNCWTYISTDPKLLKTNPMADRQNNDLLTVTAGECEGVVFAWGTFDIVKKKGRDKELAAMFPNAMALHVNKDGSPKHPLYCKSDTRFVPYYGGEKCPSCGANEVCERTPRTIYACGSSDYDQRPDTFKKSVRCHLKK